MNQRTAWIAATALLAAGTAGVAGPRSHAAEAGGGFLWRIGQADNDTREFALAPGGYEKFQRGGVYVVGHSKAKKDWPYVHPGPLDAWAGSRQHTFSVAFGLAAAPKKGRCRLVLDMVDTHGRSAPTLRVSVNGKAFGHHTPRGAGDASVFGRPEKGRQHVAEIAFPAELLRRGTNTISITSVSGSWFLYDWLGLAAPPGLKLAPATGTIVRGVRSAPMLVERGGKLCQTVQVSLLRVGEGGEVQVRVGEGKAAAFTLRPGENVVDASVPAVAAEQAVAVTVQAAGSTLARRQVVLRPVRRWVVYLLPHSHVDIGYTKVQTEVERDHWRFYEQAIEAARKTAGYPPGAQFKWNVEVLWATDSYLRQAAPEKRKAFIDAVKKGWIGLDALYGNELTALCRPEELVRLVDFACRLRAEHGLTIDSAMISDVPGYTWGIVPVLAKAGVRWFSVGPNGGHRIGHTLSTWGDRPFYWIAPDGRHKVLVWIPRTGYWRGFRGREQLMAYLRRLEGTDYPYDLLQVRHCLGDNAGPGADLCEFVKNWNTQYAYPKLKIATTREMFGDFEKRYGAELPEFRGDFTPYWEDGAGSSARETALNRAAAERLVQAGALWALLAPAAYPDKRFYAAWRNVLLYDEHTWGAHNSIREPDSAFARAQWKIKQAFALDADRQSRELLAAALARRDVPPAGGKTTAVDVFNTSSWPRTDVVTLAKTWRLAGDAVKDDAGRPVASQRLSTGELVFVARDVPPLSARRYTISAGEAAVGGAATARGNTLTNGLLTVAVDPKTGAVVSLRDRRSNAELVDRSKGMGLNDYFYVAGRAPTDARRCGEVKIAVKESGPVAASLAITCEAPGCNALVREVRLFDGLDRVEIANVVDKKKVRAKEGVHFAFPFRVRGGTVRMDTPWAVVRPEADQLPGACKNYFTVQRWVDISNAKGGVTWATVDAPLIEIGEITCDAVAYRKRWITFSLPSTTFYSYVMNNYWETNYKADQEGPTVFRYAVRPHGAYDGAAAQRFGVERSQPLIAAPAGAKSPVRPSLLRVRADGVALTLLRPSRDGKALIVRLFNTSSKSAAAALDWAEPAPKAVCLSDLAEGRGRPVSGPVELAPMEFVTLRASLPAAAEKAK